MAWFDDAFGPWYLKLYAHRDREEAARALASLDPWLPRGGRVLDVACGTGRHLEILLERGFPAFGLDRSAALLGQAPGALKPHLVRGDMRVLPFADREFQIVVSFFTSFGYFGTRHAHEALLAEFARVVAAGGRLILDVANPAHVRDTLQPVSDRAVEGHRVLERRSIVAREDGDIVEKHITVHDAAGREVASFHEEITLYGPDMLQDMLGMTGWTATKRLGDYMGSAWSHEAPRLIVLAERNTA